MIIYADVVVVVVVVVVAADAAVIRNTIYTTKS